MTRNYVKLSFAALSIPVLFYVTFTFTSTFFEFLFPFQIEIEIEHFLRPIMYQEKTFSAFAFLSLSQCSPLQSWRTK